jgi:hypothetical protein
MADSAQVVPVPVSDDSDPRVLTRRLLTELTRTRTSLAELAASFED